MKDVVPIHGADHCPGGPDPIPCGGIEWFQTQDDQSLSTTWTKVNLSGGTENGEFSTDADAGDPTFAINGDGHLEIRRNGAYLIYLHISNLSINSNTHAVVFAEMVIDAGPSTTYRRGLFGAPGGETALSARRLDFSTDVLLEEFPTIMVPLVLKNGGYTGTPLELYFNAYVEENGAPIAKNCRANLMVWRWPTYNGV